MLYRILRSQGFRAHQAKQIYKYARALVKSARENNGKKPILKKLSTRIDKYDAKVDLENQLVVVKLRNKVFKIKLLHNKDYIRKFIRSGRTKDEPMTIHIKVYKHIKR